MPTEKVGMGRGSARIELGDGHVVEIPSCSVQIEISQDIRQIQESNDLLGEGFVQGATTYTFTLEAGINDEGISFFLSKDAVPAVKEETEAESNTLPKNPYSRKLRIRR